MLTYQPFANTSRLDEVAKDLNLNVGQAERAVSSVLGATLVGVALTQPGWRRWALLIAGAALARRGLTGRCEVYRAFGVDTRHEHTHSGVESGAGCRIEHSLHIHCPPRELFDFWRQVDRLPDILSHVQAVKPITGTRSHWVVRGPLGKNFEWDADIVNEREGELIAWQSLPGSSVANAGSVRFEQAGDGGTQMRVTIEFEPPAGAVGFKAAELLGNSPQRQLENDLTQFKDFAERELTPASRSME